MVKIHLMLPNTYYLILHVQLSVDGTMSNTNTIQRLEMEHKLLQARETIQEMRRRERELTDR